MTKKTFKYNGKKHSTSNIAQGCSLFIAFSAIIAFFIIGGESIFSDYLVELIIISVIVIGMLFRLFKKKSQNLRHAITLNNDSIYIATVGAIPLDNISLDIYSINGAFSRYHLYDSENKLAIYSVFPDDFIKQLEELPIQMRHLNEISSKSFPNEVIVKYENNFKLSYSLNSGYYQFNDSEKVIPDNFMFDTKFTIIE